MKCWYRTGYSHRPYRVRSLSVQGTVALCVAFLLPIVALAQLPNADLLTVYPPYGVAGTTVEVTISGKPIEAITSLRFNDSRISGKPVMIPADDVYPTPRPAKNRFSIAIPKSTKPGIYEVRSFGYHGLSTGRPFLVLPEDAKERPEGAAHDTPEKAIPIAVDEGIYGTMGSRSMDWFKLSAKKGQRYFITVWAERLDSKLDPQLRLYDSTGRELDRNNDYFTRDPLLDFTAPADGEYTVAVSDNLYRGGGNSYHYRIEVSQRPHIDFVWPPAGFPGTKQSFTIYGRNLPGGSVVSDMEIDGHQVESLKVTLDIPKESEIPSTFSAEIPRRAMFPGFYYRVKSSNQIKIGFATAPVVFEKRDTECQTVTVPTEVAGKFDQAGDVDTFRFAAKKGKTYWLNLYSDQLGVSSDSFMTVRKVEGDKTSDIAENDDPPSFFGVVRHDATHLDTVDSVVNFTAKEDGEYEVEIINQASSGSPTHLYRLAIREQTSDFQLITTTEQTVVATNGRAGYPGSPVLRKNGTYAFRVVALRQDGFEGAIVVTAKNLPPGVTAKPLVLHGTHTGGILTVKASADVKPWTGAIAIVGKAKINGREVQRQARNASLVWGTIFADSARVRSRLDLETVLSVLDQESATCYIELANTKPLTVELKQELAIPVKVTDFEKLRKGNLTVIPFGFPGLLRSPPTVTIAEGKSEGVLKFKFNPTGNFKVLPGKYDFVLQGTGITKHITNSDAVSVAEKEVKRLEAAKKAATGNKALLSKLDAAIVSAKKQKTAAEKVAKQANTKFSTCSLPITVTVTEPAKKK